MTTEKILIGINDQVVELTGKDKEAFLQQRAKDQEKFNAQKAEQETQKQLKISAYKKLGLTDGEIGAIL